MMLEEFKTYLKDQEKVAGTIEKYLRDVGQFLTWLDGRELAKPEVAAWKQHLTEDGLKSGTVNGKLVSLDSYLLFIGRVDCKVRLLKIQRRTFRDEERELGVEEYQCLLDTAERLGKKRLYLLLMTLAATGIRISELVYITVESLQKGRAEISLKGKVRVILLPRTLVKKLREYAKENGITSGCIFRTRSGKPLGRKQAWSEMKTLAKEAGIDPKKVFPHNMRHLFAREHYRVHLNIAVLADILGHSYIETTRGYLISTGEEHAASLDALPFVS